MKILLLLFGGLLTGCLLFAQTDEGTLARVPLEHYLKGHATGDGSHMRKAFLPTAHIEGIRNGKFTSWTLDQYVALFKGGGPSPEEPKRKRWIERVEVTGNAAIATIQFDYPNTKITDYLVLLKVDGEWRIANKVYTFAPKP
ncbi:MAG: nuclear transport factor 2 family protein [Bryobacterales bacterium]|nr:nuclear transport factor 2 family protein [Bryobacterales bacterium]